MPQIGDRKRGKEIGRSGGGERSLYEWSPCRVCGKTRWVVVLKGAVKSVICKHCSDIEKMKSLHHNGLAYSNWRGGVMYRYGYKYIWLPEDSIYYPMTGRHNHYVAEHRLVMAKHLGRCLHDWEVVHHKNGIRDDNRFENLELTTNGKHMKEHSKGYRDGFQKGYLDGKNKATKEEAT